MLKDSPHNFTISIVKKVNLVTLIKGDSKAPFLVATIPRCTGGRYSLPYYWKNTNRLIYFNRMSANLRLFFV